MYSLFPLLYERRCAARRHALGRRAADGRDGPRADVAAEAAADGRAVDGPRADPRRAQLRDHQGGARRPASRCSSSSRTRTCRSRSRTAATSSRPGALVLEGKAEELLQHERPAQGVPWPLRLRRSPTVPPSAGTASRSSSSASTSTRARRERCRTRCARRTSSTSRDWDEKGAPWEYWVERRRQPARAFARSRQRRAGRDRGNDVALRGCQRARERPALHEAVEGRAHRLGVPDHRTDLARAGGAGRARHARHRGRRRDDPPRALRARDRRRHPARRDHACLLPQRSDAGCPGGRRARSRARRTRAARCVPGDRLAACRRCRARRRLSRRGRPQVSARVGGARDSSTAGAISSSASGRRRPAGSPTRTSSPWITPTTRRPEPRPGSSPARRRCRRSTPASPGSS